MKLLLDMYKEVAKESREKSEVCQMEARLTALCLVFKTKQGISLSEICAPPWKVKTFMVTRWDLQSKFRWSLTAWTMLFTTTLALLVKRKYFILNLIGRQRVIPCTSDSKQFN